MVRGRHAGSVSDVQSMPFRRTRPKLSIFEFLSNPVAGNGGIPFVICFSPPAVLLEYGVTESVPTLPVHLPQLLVSDRGVESDTVLSAAGEPFVRSLGGMDLKSVLREDSASPSAFTDCFSLETARLSFSGDSLLCTRLSSMDSWMT